MAQKISVINSRPMETPGIEGVSVAKVLKWHEKGINRNGDRPQIETGTDPGSVLGKTESWQQSKMFPDEMKARRGNYRV